MSPWRRFPDRAEPPVRTTVQRETTSRFIGLSGASIPLPICFTSTSEDSVSSALHLKRTAKVADGHASIDPIAGTAFRTGDVALDRQRTEALLADPKENAEHVMLVDLARNDLSRNAHDVQIDFCKEVQYYSHVIHLVSRVSGEIDADSNPIKTYIDTFPAGTLSGAPKVRAMQLITDIEKHNRGAYGGCIGFIGFDGDLNQAITIRTFVSRGNVLYYQAGAGIVAKSNDERELQEVNNKLGALKKAIDLATTFIN